MKLQGILSVPVIFACAFLVNCNLPGNSLKGSGNIVEEQREVAPFHRLVVDGPIEIHLLQGEGQQVRVEAEDNIIEFVTTAIEDNLLRVSLNRSPRFKPIRTTKQIKVFVTVPSITNLRASGSGNVIGSGLWQFEKMSLHINGSGDVRLSLLGDDLTIDSRGSGDLHLDGRVSHQQVTVNGSGDYDGFGLKSKTAAITLTGSGDAELDVEKELDVQLYGSGNVRYQGKPKLTSTIRGSGKVINL